MSCKRSLLRGRVLWKNRDHEAGQGGKGEKFGAGSSRLV